MKNLLVKFAGRPASDKQRLRSAVFGRLVVSGGLLALTPKWPAKQAAS